VATPEADLIQTFYSAFARGDGDAMAACYAPDVTFEDPAFGELHGAEAGSMWRMLTGRAADLEVTLADHSGGDGDGTAHWLADYTFGATGRKVHNDIQAKFEFTDGLISDHRDSFSFYAWSRQALGPIGLALGWTPILQSATRKKARAGLDEFMAAK
jgi:ketosteroid isomerase-like protein